MRSGLFLIAARVISLADASHPADGMLREVLRGERGLSRLDGREVSHAVFSYYRWLGWLNDNDPMLRRVQHALDLANRFAAEPESFSGEELTKAVPGWVCKGPGDPTEWLPFGGEELNTVPGFNIPKLDPAWLRSQWLRSLQTEPVLWLRARKGMGTGLAASLPATAHPSIPDALRYDGPEDLFRLPAFQNGDFELQDIASQAVGHACNPKPGETWWDVCAGEGGKTLHLSSLMENRGLIWASDRAEWRLRRLKQRAARAKCFNYRSAFWDGGKLPTKTKFDGVLVDAPCSGVGTWGRNPHARWANGTGKEDLLPMIREISELAEVQANLLNRSSALVKPGGRLVYSVCTLTLKETNEVAAGFQRAHPEFEPLPVPEPFAPGTLPGGQHFFWPHNTLGNGMFVAVWQRKA